MHTLPSSQWPLTEFVVRSNLHIVAIGAKLVGEFRVAWTDSEEL